jgi:hypothetical protein
VAGTAPATAVALATALVRTNARTAGIPNRSGSKGPR